MKYIHLNKNLINKVKLSPFSASNKTVLIAVIPPAGNYQNKFRDTAISSGSLLRPEHNDRYERFNVTAAETYFKHGSYYSFHAKNKKVIPDFHHLLKHLIFVKATGL